MPACLIQLFSNEDKSRPPIPIPIKWLPPVPARERIDGATVKPLILASFRNNCQGKVGRDFGMSAVEAADFILVASRIEGVVMRSGAKPHSVCGFALLQKQESPLRQGGGRDMLLDILCSCCHYGRRLLEVAENWGRALNYAKIRLNSLSSALPFYAARRYVESDDACRAPLRVERIGDENNGFRMTKCLATTDGDGARGVPDEEGVSKRKEQPEGGAPPPAAPRRSARLLAGGAQTCTRCFKQLRFNSSYP